MEKMMKYKQRMPILNPTAYPKWHLIQKKQSGNAFSDSSSQRGLLEISGPLGGLEIKAQAPKKPKGNFVRYLVRPHRRAGFLKLGSPTLFVSPSATFHRLADQRDGFNVPFVGEIRCSEEGIKGMAKEPEAFGIVYMGYCCGSVWGYTTDTLTHNFGSWEDTVFLGVFGGHGPYGLTIGRRVRDTLPTMLVNLWHELLSAECLNRDDNDSWVAKLDKSSDVVEQDHQEEEPKMFAVWKESRLNFFKVMDKELKLHPTLDCFSSRTTAVTIVKQLQMKFVLCGLSLACGVYLVILCKLIIDMTTNLYGKPSISFKQISNLFMLNVCFMAFCCRNFHLPNCKNI